MSQNIHTIDLNLIRSYFCILGVSPSATREQLGVQRKYLLNKFHPDKHPNLTDDERRLYNDKVCRINEAAQKILDQYDDIQFIIQHQNDFELILLGNKYQQSVRAYSTVDQF